MMTTVIEVGRADLIIKDFTKHKCSLIDMARQSDDKMSAKDF